MVPETQDRKMIPVSLIEEPLASTLPPTQEQGKADSGGGVPASLRVPGSGGVRDEWGWGEARLPTVENRQHWLRLISVTKPFLRNVDHSDP